MSDRRLPRRRILASVITGASAMALGPTAGRVVIASALASGSPEPQAAGIPQNALGKTGLKVPRLMQGTSMDFGVGLLRYTYEQGVTFWDTADSYGNGNSERIIGTFLERSGLRKKITIITKAGMDDLEVQCDPKTLSRELQKSLERLRTDYVDLFFLHNAVGMDPFTAELRATVDQLKKSGKIRFFGFSTHAGTLADQLTRAARLGWVDAILFRYNFRLCGDDQLNRAIDAAKSAGIGLMAMKTQASAVSFQGKVDAFRTKGYTSHQAVLKAVWNDQRIDAAVSEMSNVQQIDQNVAAARDPTRLGAAQIEELERYAAETSHLYCRGCDDLCRRGLNRPVPVGDLLRFLMYHDAYGDEARARRLYAELPPEQVSLEGLDLSGASKECPFGLDVAGLLTRASRVLKG